MSNTDNNDKKPSSLPEGLSSIADDEAITEINLTEFLEESSKAAPLFEGFHEDIENTEKSIESELQSLYDDIVGSGPEVIVPKPMSVLTASEAEPAKIALSAPDMPDESEPATLDDLWMNPEEYYDEEIPVVSLDGEDDDVYEPSDEELPEVYEPAPEAEEAQPSADAAKDDIFGMIDMLKADADGETGFGDILSEIEANAGIATVDTELSVAAQLVTDPAAFEADREDIEWELPEEEETPEQEVVIIPDDGATVMPEDVLEKIPVQAEAIDTDSDEFQRELAILLGDEVPEAVPAEQNEADTGFVIDVPDDGNDYEAAAQQPEKLYEPEPMSSGIAYMTEEEFEAKQAEKKKSRKKEKEEKPENKKNDTVSKIVLAISAITIVVCLVMIANTYIIEPMKFRKTAQEVVDQMNENISQHDQTAVVDSRLENEFPGVDFPEGMLAKYGQLYAANQDLRGWISIAGLDINLPVAQGVDNSYYLKKDIYGKYTTYGVPFFDYRMTDFRNLHKNNVIYGHNMRSDDYIFGNLENYRTIDGFASAPVIECNTIYGDYTWFVYAVFITNSEAQDDNGYVLPYNFIDISTSKFESYIEELDKRKLYTTGVDINANDKILTLSTCCYDFNEARLVVVARLRRDGESVSVDTSKAVENPNPKFPQAYYDANKKAVNPYANDAHW